MAQPPKYIPDFNFTDFQTADPATPLPGNEVDSELTSASISINKIIDNLKRIQRDDGELANASVGPDQIQPGLAMGINAFLPWAPGTYFAKGNGVFYNNAIYYANSSGYSTASFSADLAAGVWSIIFDFSSVFTGLLPQLLYPLSFRNGLRNGEMRVAQRGTSFTGVSALVQTLDNWFGWCYGGASNATHSQVAGATAIDGMIFPNALRVQRPAANTSTNTHAAGQIILNEDLKRFAGKSCYLTYYARSGANFSAAGHLLGIRVESGTSADEGSAALIGGTWTGGIVVSNTTQNIGVNGSLTRYAIPITVPANSAELSAEFSFVPVGTAGANDWIDVTGVQLEAVANFVSPAYTPFEQLPFDHYLRSAKRFYRKSFPYSVAPVQNVNSSTGTLMTVGMMTSANTFGGSFDFDTPMRVAPAVTTYNPFAANANWRDTSNSADRVVTVQQISPDRVTITGAAGVLSSFNQIHYTAEAAI